MELKAPAGRGSIGVQVFRCSAQRGQEQQDENRLTVPNPATADNYGTESMTIRDTHANYGLVTRGLHWLLFALIVAQLLLALSFTHLLTGNALGSPSRRINRWGSLSCWPPFYSLAGAGVSPSPRWSDYPQRSDCWPRLRMG